MCDATSPTGRTRAVAHPRWGMLYGTTIPQLAALAVVEACSPPSPVRIALRCALVLGTFAGMAAWIHSNRAALDLQEWCDCAGRTITVRLIESHPPASPFADAPLAPSPDWGEEVYEVAQR